MFKSQLAESKESGESSITIQYKEEIEAIFDKIVIQNPILTNSSESSSRKKVDPNIWGRTQIKTPHMIPKISRRHGNDNEDANLDVQSK